MSVTVHHADNRDVLATLADNSIDAVVTDPPYALVSIQKRFGKPGAAPAKGDVYARASAVRRRSMTDLFDLPPQRRQEPAQAPAKASAFPHPRPTTRRRLTDGERACYVEQGHYGHAARKATYLYAVGIGFDRFQLVWDRTRANVPAWMIERYGEAKARKIGVVAMIGGKDKTRLREATPEPFRDVLIDMARSACATFSTGREA